MPARGLGSCDSAVRLITLAPVYVEAPAWGLGSCDSELPVSAAADLTM